MFTRKHPGPAIAEPVPPPDPDAEPSKVGPDGFLSREWSSWQWRDAERRLGRTKRVNAITYTPDQTRQLVAAQAVRNEAAAAVDRLTTQLDDLDERRANEADALGSLAAQGYTPRETRTAELDQMLAELDRRLAPAVDKLRRAEVELRQVTDHADADVARRQLIANGGH
ncbi:MAG: hypothetical protein M3Q66_02415 [Chloroflexota bacterium]|nr:hypothetical protein [Chloroflexota bacterium]